MSMKSIGITSQSMVPFFWLLIWVVIFPRFVDAACWITPDVNGAVTIPDGTTSIGALAFKSCATINSVAIPASVTSIGVEAFSLSSLTTVTIASGSVGVGIGVGAFSGSKISSIVIPDSVTSIGVSAFQSCTSLTTVTIPGSGVSIGGGAFASCTSLTSFTVLCGAPVLISGNVFTGATALSSITLASTSTSSYYITIPTVIVNCPPGCAAGYGYESTTATCVQCAPGKYKDTEASTGCTACKAGYTTTGSGSSALTFCSVCAAGYYGATVTPNTSGCTACAAGYTTTGSGDTAVSACVCANGYGYDSTTEPTCTKCVTGKYKGTVANAACLDCTLGYTTTSSGSTAATSCSKCAVGYYGSTVAPNTSGCTACAVGYTTNGAGKRNVLDCNVCALGYYSSSGFGTGLGNAGCFTCDVNSIGCGDSSGFSIGLNDSPGLCKAGYSYSTPSGTYALCTACTTNYYKDTVDNVACTPCPPGSQTLIPAATYCVQDPSGQPSSRPTMQPSAWPTRQPTSEPTDQPTRQPSSQPTAQPSQPTSQPSGQPTTQPSSQPTGRPSRLPTCQPTGRPTSQPTQPTSQPSGQPTTQPSSQPTSQPSHRPSGQPTGQPTSQPTQPTSRPTNQPSGQPTSRPSRNCQPGQYLDVAANICVNCPPGKYNSESDSSVTEGEETCINCPSGKYSNVAGMLLCADAPRGYLTALGASQPTLCEPSFYSDSTGLSACAPCRSGTVTTFFGADSKKQCVSPAGNFVQGYIAVAIDVIFGFQYLLRGRFHRVAFVRLKRILESLSTNAGGTITYISYLRVKASSERLNITTERRAKTWSFILGAVFILLFVSSLAFLHEFSTIFFKALVIFKSLRLNFDFGAKIAHVISQFGRDVWSQVVTKLLGVLTKVLESVAYFKIDFAVIAVNCQGATAPFTMFQNILVLGAAMMFIDGRFQEFLLLKCIGLIKGHSAIIGKHIVKEWYMRQDGTQVHATKRGKIVYYSISVILLVLKGALSVDLIQTLLQFITSTVNVSVFFENGLLHGYDQNCNVVAGWTGAEASIALLTSVANWLFIIPAMYTVSRVLIPRLPPGVTSFDTTKDDEPLFRSYIGLHKALKLFSYFSPDLWMSFLTSKYLHNLPYHIPAQASMSSASLSKQKAEELRAVDATNNMGFEHSDKAEGSALEFATLLSAIETPLHPTYRIACNAKAPYIGLYRCKSIACKYKMWHAPQMYLTDAGDNYVLVKIARSAGLVESTLIYDVYHEGLNAEGRNAADLAVELNSTSDQFVVVLIVLANEHTSHRLEGGLAEAVLRCGGSRDIFGASKLQGSYLLIGVPGCGERSGYECVSVNSEFDFSVDFSVLKPEHGKLGWRIDEEISSSKSFLNVASKTRSKRENMEWKRFKIITLPTYWDLCVMEYKVMLAAISQLCGGNSCLLSIVLTPVLAILTAVGLGHGVTSVGRRAMYVVYWNYSRFLMFAAGIVTTDLAYIFDIHEKIHRDSCVWNDASVVASHRLQDIVSQPSDNQLFTDKQSSSLSSHDGNGSEAGLQASVDIDKAVNHNNDSNSVLQSDSQQQYSRYEERKTVLERQVLQKQLRADYGICIYASIATRATLCQLFPYVSFLSMFAAFTSAHPFFVYDKYLESNLQEGIVRDPFTRWRQMAQQEIDLEYELRTKETREDSYVLPVPPEGETNAYGTREQVEAKNKASREIFKQVVAQDKPLVREWEVRLQGVVWYVTGSRYIQYGKGVFKFIMSILLLYCGDKSSKPLLAVMLVGLSPFVFVQCLQVVIVFGTIDSMCITDEELLKERDRVMRFLRTAYRCLSYCFSFFSKNKSKSQSEHTPDEAPHNSAGPSSPLDDTSSNSIEMRSMAVEGMYVKNPLLVVDATKAVTSGKPKAAAPEPERGLPSKLPALAANSSESTGNVETVEPMVVFKPLARPLAATVVTKAPPGDVLPTVDAVSTATSTADQDVNVSALSRSRKMALQFEDIAERASMSSTSTTRKLELEALPRIPNSREDAAHSLSRSRAMAQQFEDIAERASMSSASTSRKLELEALPRIPTDGEDSAHSLSRSRKMAIKFEEIAERAALGSAADLDLAGKNKEEEEAGVDEVSTAASGVNSSHSKEAKHHHEPVIKRDFTAAIESAKQRADLEYSL